MQLFSGLGATYAVTRYAAYYSSLGEREKAAKFSRNAVLFTLLTGFLLAGVSFALSGPIASLLLHRPQLTSYIELISIIQVGQAMLQAGVAAAIGWNAMGLATTAGITQSVTRMIVSPLLIVVGLGVAGAVAGYTVSYFLGGVFAVTFLYLRGSLGRGGSFEGFWTDAREMVRFGLPPLIGGILSGLTVYYVPLVLASIVSNTEIGYFSAANALTVPISLVSSATGSALFPAFAGLDGMKADVASAFKKATKYLGYIVTPVIFFLALCSKQFMVLLYGPQFAGGEYFLALLALSYTPILLGLGVFAVFFNGIGRTRLTLYISGASAAALFISAPILAIGFNLGVQGTIYALFIGNLVLVAAGLGFLRKLFSATPFLWAASASLVSGTVSYAIGYVLPAFQSDLLTLAFRFVIFAVVYFSLGPLLGAVNLADLDLLQRSLGDMRFVGRLAAPIFRFQRIVASRSPTRTKNG
jgi:O-antigen/teichoic acid export membrane protein